MVDPFITINSENISLLSAFLDNAGGSLKTFRYFDKRPLSSISNHLYTTVYMFEDQPVGYGHLDQEGDVVWLGIAVKEGLTGKGIGKKIMDKLLQKGRKLEIKKIRLSVDADNTPAVKLYKQLGFEQIKEAGNILYFEIGL